MTKQKYYSSKKLRKVKCDYYFIIGQKSNGKSFDVKSLLIKEALKDGRRFAYMRRWFPDRTASKVERYFTDDKLFIVNDYSPYTEVQAYTDTIYLGNRTEQGKKTKEFIIGYSVGLSSEQHYASMPFPEVYNILFEEFITDTGYFGQGTDEVELFLRMCSTIFRERKDTCVYMLGNTISRFCPYFTVFGIDINKLEKGNIYYFEYIDKENDNIIKIGLEWCDNIVNNKIVFGKSAKMINKGEWLTSNVPIVNRNTRQDKLLFKYYVKKENSIYKCLVLNGDNNEPYIFVYPYNDESKIKSSDRYFTDNIEMQSICHCANLTKSLTCDILLNEIYKLNRICYSDSLTGTEFETIRNERGWK